MIKKYLNRLFIDGLSGMASGLFATLIIGTIIAQIGTLVKGDIGTYLIAIGGFAKTVTGAGIGVGVAAKLAASPLVTVSAAVAGMIGAFPNVNIESFVFGRPGEPLGAFVAAYIAIELGGLVAGKTKVDIIVTPLVSIITGGVAGLFLGLPISKFMAWIGAIVNFGVEQQPILCGIIVSVVMGIALTLPISSAAIGVSLKLSGLAAGAAVAGCCANMIGFAVASFKDNKWGGLVSQGVGTSMLQMPNIVRKPIIWLPAIIASAITGPISAALLKMVSTPTGSGMGTAGLVGPIETFAAMVEAGVEPVIAMLEILVMCFILPGAIALGVASSMRKLGLIKNGDMKL
ncbi:MAG: PTS sugar transporter subunit IIC [Ruminococcaceae bacterium]|nr:PTS sugar transporter subunit IIC [Oscillospiraceae bacterium]